MYIFVFEHFHLSKVLKTLLNNSYTMIRVKNSYSSSEGYTRLFLIRSTYLGLHVSVPLYKNLTHRNNHSWSNKMKIYDEGCRFLTHI